MHKHSIIDLHVHLKCNDRHLKLHLLFLWITQEIEHAEISSPLIVYQSVLYLATQRHRASSGHHHFGCYLNPSLRHPIGVLPWDTLHTTV